MNEKTRQVPVSGRFHENCIIINNLENDRFREWLFMPSQIFLAEDKWWGIGGKRGTLHEGIDICVYRTEGNVTRYLSGETKVPAVFSGKVEKVIDDFLGKSVFISSDNLRNGEDRFFTLFGHINPIPDITPGAFVTEGEIVGTISDTKRTPVRPHLHISFAWISDSVPTERLDWDTLTKTDGVTLIDPFEILSMPYAIVTFIQKTPASA